MKTPLEQLEFWIEQYYIINGTPTLSEIKGQIELLKDYEKQQLALTGVVQAKPEVCDCCGSDTSGTVNLCKECADDI